MYKVFFNKKPIFLTTEFRNQTEQAPVFYIKFSSVENILKALKSKKTDCLYLYHKSEDKLWKHFLKYFPIVKAAGGLVRHQDQRLLFIYRNNKWDLPKGRIERQEKVGLAAIREVEEECGISNLKLVKPLITTYHTYFQDGLKLKETFWFLMTSDFEEALVPQLEEGITIAVFKNQMAIINALQNSYKNIELVYDTYLKM